MDLLAAKNPKRLQILRENPYWTSFLAIEKLLVLVSERRIGRRMVAGSDLRNFMIFATPAKSTKPRSTSVSTSSTVTWSPTSKPLYPRTTLPSAAGRSIRTQVPLSEAPVTIPSNRSPTRDSSKSAAADFRTCRSTLAALSSWSVQWPAKSLSSSELYGLGVPESAAFSSRCVIRSGKRRFGAVECV